MITRIEVDGFKTLSGFSLDLFHGINVLVGPNGSGKTNIITFFEFVSNLIKCNNVSEATSRSGGAGVVFKRIGSGTNKEFRSKIYGCIDRAELPVPFLQQDKEFKAKPFLFYLYTFEIEFSEGINPIFFKAQSLRLKCCSEFISSSSIDKESYNWDLICNTRVSKSYKVNAQVDVLRKSLLETTLFMYRYGSKKNRRNFFKDVISSSASVGEPLPKIIERYIPVLRLCKDLSGGEIYNIIPSSIKLPEDSARPPRILKDGSGLSATLNALKKGSPIQGGNEDQTHLRTPKAALHSNTLTELLPYYQQANPTISDIDVVDDTFSNQLRVTFEIENGAYTASVPLALMSDGTLKWITLITAAFTAKSMFSIEEPENYLHPRMQSRIVSIMRELLIKNEKNAFTLMTTHSETLLNKCQPEELIIVSLINGSTVAHRNKNPDIISKEIRETGFGLGYYYTTGALGDD